ncbi:XrtA/PEP-CTERM system TPR-repeat protein PrsT [Thauera linaloolentis]|uniref:Uncharacterized protein n=1 Tax=Thauera linaloolentis (strain DSM 12138 / JCM 21573 / CCUG 41526 / CIP 105981 / IAM 15112 / NBRC 102519 / 47Lol) TaxID=1123367 RepID=N6Y646_THAL4|nr:XrtA/PEP-CTERM system TPR-repeat protein PrsT [Thauera linaloolentis]ENO89686.1 hypothetical protein C666_05220 [Thauera linaloolentis 47Lol = DSM 12138]MCM8567166.1 PEP-CTERM system TPR-repeat protein PrsT [Thauera linaloolentis]
MNRSPRSFARVLAIGAASLFLCASAFAGPVAASRYYEDGLKRFEEQDVVGAIIQLKNALQQDRDMLAAHLLLARAYFRQGDVGPAEVEFREALRLGVNRAEVAVPLARIYLLQGRPAVLLENVPAEGLPAAARLEVLSLRGLAHAALGQRAQAEHSFADARALDPSSPVPLAAEVPMLIGSGNLALARERAELAVRNGPEFAQAFNARASVAHSAGDLPQALADYERAVALDPGLIDAVVARAGILVDLGRDEEAKSALEVTRGGPTEPRAAYLLALIAERQGDAAQAARYLAEAAGLVDALPSEWVAGHEQLLMVGALAHHAGRQFEKARKYLEAAIVRYPNNQGARKLLASIHLDMNDHARATGLLEHVLRVQPGDAQALNLLGRVNLAQRRYGKASELFEEAARGGDVHAQSALGFSQLGLGDVGAAVKSLQLAFERSPGDLAVANALANILMRQEDHKGALSVAERASAAVPGNPVALNLLGAIKSATGDAKGARAAFDAALQRNAAFMPARLNLARLDVAEGRLERARQTYAELLKQNRSDVVAMHESGMLEQRAGNLREAARWFEKAAAERPDDIRSGLALIGVRAEMGDKAGALEASKALAVRKGSDLAVLAALAESQIAVGDNKAAQQTLREMTRIAEFDAPRLVRIGYLQLAAGNPAGAAYSAQKALQGRPGDEAAMVLEIEAALLGPSDALAGVDGLIAALRAAHPSSASGSRLAGDRAVQRRRFDEAERHYRDAFASAPSLELLQRRASVAVLKGEPKSLVPVLKRWLAENGDEPRVREMLAELWMRDGDWKAARDEYERLVSGGNAGASVFNNLANVRLVLGEGDPVPMAERAHALAPGDVGIVDTLGWALAHAGRLDEAMRHLRDARLRAPEDPEIRWHLAYVLAKLGRVAEARGELQSALRESPDGAWVGKARELLGQLE